MARFSTMKNFNPQIDLQCILVGQILNSLHSDVLDVVYSYTQKEHGSLFDSKSYREGNCFKVEKNSLPDLYRICQEVIKALGFKEPIDFYLSGDADINAHSWEAENDDELHLIEINSALFNLMNEDELKFVIGHEIGHLISHDMLVKTLINFAYPDEDTIPTYIDVRRKLLDHISEFAADRYGYLANYNLEACVSALYKLASGIDLQKMNVSVPTLIQNNEQHIRFFMEEQGEMFGDHPVTPLRVQALHTFSIADSQDQVDQCIYDIFHCISRKLFDDFCIDFSFSAGMLMAEADGEISKKEMSVIAERMGHDCLDPNVYFEEFKGCNLNTMFDESVQKILEHYGLPARENMMRYILKVMLADGNVTEAEVDLAFQMGSKMQLPNEEIAAFITEAMRSDYLPKITVE